MSIAISPEGVARTAQAPAKEPTKAEILAELKALGISAGKGLNKAELEKMLSEAKGE